MIDGCITGALYSLCIGWLYDAIKDGVREGQSVGKGMLGLRVVDYHTGVPATIYQSFLRNCIGNCIDVSCCYLVAFIDKDGRRIGDQIAGTVVIQDK